MMTSPGSRVTARRDPSRTTLVGPKNSYRALTLLMCLLASTGLLRAQVDTGAIVGTVTDSAGSSVPDASIKLLEESTGRTINGQSAQDGSYSFSPVKIGSYTLSVEKAGFKS